MDSETPVESMSPEALDAERGSLLANPGLHARRPDPALTARWNAVIARQAELERNPPPPPRDPKGRFTILSAPPDRPPSAPAGPRPSADQVSAAQEEYAEGLDPSSDLWNVRDEAARTEAHAAFNRACEILEAERRIQAGEPSPETEIALRVPLGPRPATLPEGEAWDTPSRRQAVNAFVASAETLGGTPELGGAAHDYVAHLLSDPQAPVPTVADGMATLTAEWGDATEANLRAAREAFRRLALAPAERDAILDEPRLGNDADLLRALAWLGGGTMSADWKETLAADPDFTSDRNPARHRLLAALFAAMVARDQA